MKDESDDWPEGQLHNASASVVTNDTDCSDWESDIPAAEWSEGCFRSAAIAIPPAATGNFNEAIPTANVGGISNDAALAATRDRIAYVLDLLTQLRASSPADEFARVSGTYRAEVERLQSDVLDYLVRPAATLAES